VPANISAIPTPATALIREESVTPAMADTALFQEESTPSPATPAWADDCPSADSDASPQAIPYNLPGSLEAEVAPKIDGPPLEAPPSVSELPTKVPEVVNGTGSLEDPLEDEAVPHHPSLPSAALPVQGCSQDALRISLVATEPQDAPSSPLAAISVEQLKESTLKDLEAVLQDIDFLRLKSDKLFDACTQVSGFGFISGNQIFTISQRLINALGCCNPECLDRIGLIYDAAVLDGCTDDSGLGRREFCSYLASVLTQLLREMEGRSAASVAAVSMKVFFAALEDFQE